MYVKRLRLQNIGPHRSLELEFERGLVGVIGENGAGKSTVLNSLGAVLTNNFGRFSSKSGCVYDMSPPEEPAAITVEFVHRQQSVWLERRLRPKVEHEIVVGKEKAITGAPKVAERLVAVFGCDPAAIDLYGIKYQNEIYAWLDAAEAVRRKAFNTLCNTEDCEEIWEVVGKVLNKDADVNAVIEDNSDAIAEQLAKLGEDRAALMTARAEQEVLRLSDVSFDSVQRIVRKGNRCEDLVAAQEREQDRTEPLNATLRQAQLKFNHTDRRRQKVRAKAEKLSIAVIRANIELERWKEHEAAATERAWREKDRAVLVKRLAQLKPPGKPQAGDVVEDTPAALEELSDLKATLSRANYVLSQLKDGVTSCPVCGTAASGLKAHLAEQRRIVKEYPVLIDSLVAKIQAVASHMDDTAEYKDQKRDLETKIASLDSAISLITKTGPPPTDKAELKAMVQEHKALSELLDDIERRYDQRKAYLEKIRTTINLHERRLVELADGIEKNTVMPAKVKRAAERLQEHNAAITELARLDGMIGVIDSTVSGLKAQLRTLRSRLARSRKVKKMATILQDVRDAAHRSNLPGLVAHAVLEDLVGGINADLALFGDPFWVEANNDLTFTVHKPGHPPQPSSWLSAGQKSVLAIPFWFAWRSDLGMLALDEPTSNLDVNNQTYLAEALERLAESVRGSRQVIMVTHAESLRPSFDQVIDLGRV